MEDHEPYYIVGIGLSAGGLKPLLELFDQLPSGLDAGFLVANHLLPGYKSEMTGILQKHTRMRVEWAVDQQKIKRDHIYILSEGAMLQVRSGALQVRKRRAAEVVNKAIDILFSSMATDLDGRAISIILSGMDGDGTIGSVEVHRGGGITFAQEPASAEFAGMPGSAILNGEIMFVRSVRDIADLLMEITRDAGPVITSRLPADAKKPGDMDCDTRHCS